MDNPRLEEIRQRLIREYQATLARLRELGSPLAEEPMLPGLLEGDAAFDPFDQVAVSEAREHHFASRERLTERLGRLAAALARLAEGTYGTCLVCGRPIGLARLRAIPEATACVECQARAEREPLGSGPESRG
jgi:RNA polymerase-binding protein DksA